LLSASPLIERLRLARGIAGHLHSSARCASAAACGGREPDAAPLPQAVGTLPASLMPVPWNAAPMPLSLFQPRGCHV
jgi:hypothetical protein